MQKKGNVWEEMLFAQAMCWRNVWEEMLLVEAFAFVPDPRLLSIDVRGLCGRASHE